MGAVAEYLKSYTHHLDQMVERAQQLEGVKTIASLARHSYAPADLTFKTTQLQMLTTQLDLLRQALEEETEYYQEQYQAAHPGFFHDVMTRCQELKDRLLGGSMLTIKRILCSRSTPPQGFMMHRPYPEGAFAFCEGMIRTKRLLTQIMFTCRYIIHEENDIRLDADRCLQIFEDSYKAAVEKNQPLIKIILKTNEPLEPNEYPKAHDLACQMKKARSTAEAICQCFHAYDDSTFQLFVAHHYADMMRQQQRLSPEHALWADNDEMSRKAIYVMENFDRLGPGVLGKRQKADGQQHAIKAKAVLMLYNWCVARGCPCSENRFVKFFQEHYKGAHKPPTLSSVNGQKNRSNATPKEQEAFEKKVDKIIHEMQKNKKQSLSIRMPNDD